jgi:putative flippase GtrA
MRFLKFNLVGALGIAVQLGALALLRSGLHLDYLLATALAVETAVIHNFLWHERFTWRDRTGGPGSRPRVSDANLGYSRSFARLACFNLTNGAVSIAGNLVLMRALVGTFRLNYLIANLAAVTVCSAANFLLSDKIVFVRGAVRER